MTNNPYEAPQAKVIEENPHSPPRRNYGGIKRLSYLGIMITLVILQAIIAAGSDRADPSGDNGLLAGACPKTSDFLGRRFQIVFWNHV